MRIDAVDLQKMEERARELNNKSACIYHFITFNISIAFCPGSMGENKEKKCTYTIGGGVQSAAGSNSTNGNFLFQFRNPFSGLLTTSASENLIKSSSSSSSCSSFPAA